MSACNVTEHINYRYIENAINWAVGIANDDTHGYDQDNRWGPDYDCASFIIQAFENAGCPVKSNGATYTGNMVDVFVETGFNEITYTTGMTLIRGDVLWKRVGDSGHTALYMGNNQMVSAHINENGATTGGETGDQTKHEIDVSSLDTSWVMKVLRLPSSKCDCSEDSGNTDDSDTDDTNETLTPSFSNITVSTEKLGLYSQEQVNNAYHIWAHLVGLSMAQSSLRFYWDKLSSAAVIGNMVVESSVNPDVFQGFVEMPDDPYTFTGGYGLVQWTPASKFWTWADENRNSWRSSKLSIMHAQLARIMYEYENPTVQWNKSKGYQLSFTEFALNTRNLSLDELTYSWAIQYEQPKDLTQSIALRKKYAEYYYTLFTGLKPKKRKMPWIYYLQSPAIKYL